jgi:hypothetical protein
MVSPSNEGIHNTPPSIMKQLVLELIGGLSFLEFRHLFPSSIS